MKPRSVHLLNLRVRPIADEQIIEYAIQAVFLHLTWLFKVFTAEDKDDPVKILALNEKRDRAVEIFQKLALKELSNAPISVKRQVSCLER